MALNITNYFGSLPLTGLGVINPTSIQFGPDGRIYVSQQDGLIKAATVQEVKNASDMLIGYTVVGQVETIDIIQDIPNHNDDGTLNTVETTRQSTGFVVEEGANGEVVIYVGSSDPRIGGGVKGEKNLDTNSGVISRLVQQPDGSWEKVDLVIGLPRSEENHSVNGLDIRTEMVNGQPHKIMYAASGGNTNAGSPGDDFEWISEYYYSAAILRIDLTQLEQMESALVANGGLNGGTSYVDSYVYALPTLDDPTRANDANGFDTAVGTTGTADAEAGDTFGGNNGRNQAKYDPNGPVQVYSMGYRNQYDVVLTEAGNLYSSDNGPNAGWGNKPITANDESVTSSTQVASNKPNVNIEDGNDGGKDNLHLVTEGLYAGHPNPVYASGAAAGLYTVDDSSGTPVVIQLTDPSDPANDPNTTADDLPSDWSTITGGITHPEAGVYLQPPGFAPVLDGTTKGADGSILNYGSSTNGLAEYTAGGISDVASSEILISASFNGDITFAEIVSDGTQAGTSVTDTATINTGGTPLDLTSVGANGVDGAGLFAGTIWAAQFGVDAITVLVPGVETPPDTDQDDDGLDNNVDPLQDDATNGASTILDAGSRLFWDFNPSDSGSHPGPSGEFNVGLTGWMINGTSELDDLRDLDNTIRGGAPGIVQVKSVADGDFLGSSNNQQDAIQTGFSLGNGVDKFVVKVPLLNPFASDANTNVAWSEEAAMGVSIGDGTMSNALAITVGASNAVGAPIAPRIRVTYEEGDVILADFEVSAPELLLVSDGDQIELFFTVDMQTMQVTPAWRYQTSGSWSALEAVGGSSVTLQSNGVVAQALQGQHSINGVASSSVVTLVSTSSGSEAFTADFLDLTIATPTALIQSTEGTTEVVEGELVGDSYSVFLSTPPSSDVTITLNAGSDITLDQTQLVFTPQNWDVPQFVSITAVDDTLNEGDETIAISHVVTSTDLDFNGLSLPDVAVTVVDNDVPGVVVTQSGGNTEVSENGATDSYTLALATQPTDDVTVTLSHNSQIALDQTQLVFTAQNWDVPQAVTIAAIDDTIPEGDRVANVSHSLASNDVDYDGQTVEDISVLVVDNDGPPPTFILHRINVGGSEVTTVDGSVWAEDSVANPSPYRVGGGTNLAGTGATIDLSDASLPANAQAQAIFRSERWDKASGESMRWEFDVDEGDYVVNLYFAENYGPAAQTGGRVFDVAVEGTVPTAFDDIDQFATAGSKNKAFMVSHITTVEDGTLDLEFLHGIQNTNLKGIEVFSIGSPGTPDLSINDVTVNETDSTATFTASLSNFSDSQVTVDFATSDGIAVAGSDYIAQTGSLTFDPGETTQTITIDITDDTYTEDDETFAVLLSNANGANLADGTGLGTILANDPVPELSINDVTVSEADGTATFTVSLANPDGSTVTVDYATADGTAIAGSDYVSKTGTVTFGPNDITQTITVDITDDLATEGNETFTVALSNAQGADLYDGTGTAAIADNDIPAILLTETGSATEVSEDGITDTYELVLATQPVDDVIVTVSSDSQVMTNTTQLVFTATNWNIPQQVTVSAVDDALPEVDQTVTLTHAASSSDPSYDGQAISDVSVTVIDNDGEPPSFALHRINVGGSEVTAPDGSVWSADTAANPSPFRIGSGGSQISGTGAGIDLSDPSVPASANVADIFQIGRWDKGSGDPMRWEFDVADGAYEVRLYLSENFNGAASVGGRVFDVAVEGAVPTPFDDIDAFALTGNKRKGLMLSSTTTVSDGTLNLDFLHEVENPHIKGIEILAIGTTGTPDLAIGDVAVNEADGTATFDVSLSTISASDVSVDFATVDGTAVGGLDFTAASGSLLFAAGETSKTVTVNITDDPVTETDETFTVQLSNVSGANLIDGTGEGTILASDPLPEITIDDVAISEANGTATFTVSLTAASTSPVTVDYATADGTATAGSDYISKTDTLTFAAGVTTQTITVDITDDSAQEGDETFSIQLSNPSGATIADGSGLGTIADNDMPEVLLTETDLGTEVGEDGTTDSYALVLTTQPTDDVTIALMADSQVTLDKTQVVFTAANWNVPQNVTIIAVDDTTPEADQTIAVSHTVTSSDANYNGQTISDLAVTVTDNDGPLPTTVIHRINVGGAQVTAPDGAVWTEDSAANPSIYRVGNGGDRFSPTGVAIDLSDPSLPTSAQAAAIFQTERWDAPSGDSMQWAFDVANGDYEVRLYLAENFNGAASVGGRVFDVAVEGAVATSFDDIDQFAIAGDKRTGVMVATTATVSDGTLDLEFIKGVQNPNLKGLEILAIGSVTPTTPDLAIDDVTVNEADGTATFTASLSAASTSPVTVDFTTLDGTAISGSDYTANTGNLTFAAGETIQAITVAITDDTDAEPNESFTVELSNVSGANLIDGVGLGTVTDNDTAQPSPTNPFAGITPVDVVVSGEVGSAEITITGGIGNVQKSNFGIDSFRVTNTGDKRIAAIYFDVTKALFPDTVFDPQGIAGDTAARGLLFGDTGTSGVNEPDSGKNDPGVTDPFLGTGGVDGYEGMLITFDANTDNGYNPGEMIQFGVDMDPNSIAGLPQQPVDINGNDPRLIVNNKGWDIGGVSGAELINSEIQILFTDGTTATGELMGDGSQAGAIAVVAQNAPSEVASLTINGLTSGQSGTYDPANIQVQVNGDVGDTVRVTMSQGFIQPFAYTDPNGTLINLAAQLDGTDFPANNAVKFQTVDVTLTSTQEDITSQFDFSAPGGNISFLGDDKLPIALTATVIDGTTDKPRGPVSDPISLIHEDVANNTNPVAQDDLLGTTEAAMLVGNVLDDNGNGLDSDLDGDVLTVTAVNDVRSDIGTPITLDSGALLTLSDDGSFSYDPNGQFNGLTTGQTDTDSFTYTINDGNFGSATAIATITVNGL